MKREKIQIGSKVFIIDRDLSIVEKQVLAVIDSGDKIGYTLDENSCGGYCEEDVFITKSNAEVALQNFLDGLKFHVGDLVVGEFKNYSKKEKFIGRIVSIKYSDLYIYEVIGCYEKFDNISEEQILLKVKNEFIDNYGNILDLYNQFEEKEKEIRHIISLINNQHEELEKELKHSISKQYNLFGWNRKKPLFKDRFDYVEERW